MGRGNILCYLSTWRVVLGSQQTHHKLVSFTVEGEVYLVMSGTFQFSLLFLLAGIVVADAAYKNVADGPHSCGGVEVPYPFGVVDDNGKGDFRDGEVGFSVACKAGKMDFFGSAIGNFSIKTAEVTVWLPVRWQCYDSSGQPNGSLDLSNGLAFNNKRVYRLSSTGNSFFVLGCNTLGYLWSDLVGDANVYNKLIGCTDYCRYQQSAVDGVCHGVGCCEAYIPPGLIDNTLYFRQIFGGFNESISFSPCDYAFVAQKGYYTFQTADLNMNLHQTKRLMPVRLDWAIRDSATCEEAKNNVTYACKSSNSICLNSTNGPGYICNCSSGYQGNPYIENGCTGKFLLEQVPKVPLICSITLLAPIHMRSVHFSSGVRFPSDKIRGK
jgi:hypothetical protein